MRARAPLVLVARVGSFGFVTRILICGTAMVTSMTLSAVGPKKVRACRLDQSVANLENGLT